MRIAVSGTHFAGKSSLIKSLLKSLPNFKSLNEPYHLLEEEGYEFSEPPSLEEFEHLIKRSITEIDKSPNNIIFDRCPLDYLAYAQVCVEKSSLEEDFDIEGWIEKIGAALQRLDLILFIPIEYPDRILVPAVQDKKLRMKVDEKLQEMLLEDSLEILENIEVLEVTGALEKE